VVVDVSRAVTAAVLIVSVVDVATAAADRARLRLAMQNSVTAEALPPVVNGRLTTASVRPEDSVLDVFAAADLVGPVVGFTSTAGVILAVYERVATAA